MKGDTAVWVCFKPGCEQRTSSLPTSRIVGMRLLPRVRALSFLTRNAVVLQGKDTLSQGQTQNSSWCVGEAASHVPFPPITSTRYVHTHTFMHTRTHALTHAFPLSRFLTPAHLSSGNHLGQRWTHLHFSWKH